ncbi:MAG: type II toxin-antitoxin system VapC family toxin [Candidatus Aenigmarchaeota archaeon]|nr:type II toxin-antitoxin system VapC family toxin [Candidatus Aenigmarchaeota archaeon]
MKRKKLQKILRKFQRLPSHVMDTNILIEALKDTKLGNICSDYLNRIGYKYRGFLCSSVLGEFLLHVLKDIKEPEERRFMLEFIDKISRKTKCGYSSLKYESFHIVDKIKEIDSRIEDMDAIHLANCIQDKANVFVTLDEKLVSNTRLEKEFSIKILHPEKL